MTEHTFIADRVKVTVGDVELINSDGPVTVTYVTDLCGCGEKSDYGCHGIRDGEVYSEFYCKKCHNKRL